MGQTARSDRYFATLDGLEYLDALKNKVRIYRNYLASSGMKGRWALSLGAYYGASEDGKQSWRITPGGEFGELVQSKVNDYASFIKHQVVLAVQQRPAGIAKAINTDVETLADARVGSLLCEYYLTDPAHRFEQDYVQSLELALLAAEAFIVQDWDMMIGTELVQDAQGALFAGDLTQTVYPIWNAACDLGSPTAHVPWRIFSRRENKFELAARYPASEQEIILAGSSGSGIPAPLFFQMGTDHTDFIETHYLVHLPTLACRTGRVTKFLSDEILFDAKLYPYPARNFHRVSAGEMFETAFGHTSNYDLLGLEQVTDTLHSVVLNNQSTFGVSTIVGPKGSGLAHQELAKGLRYLEMDEKLVDKVRPLNLTSTPPEIFNYLNMLGIKKGEISGINSILRGDPQGMLKGASGSAMALLQSQAIQFNSGVQNAFYRLLSAGGTGMIEILRKFADEPRMFRIAGKFNQHAISEFKFDKKTLESVSTILFEPVNPIMQTASGKLTVADNLLEKEIITDGDDYIECLTTGNLGVIFQDRVAKKEAIMAENEAMQDGEQVLAVSSENHQKHIEGHSVLIEMPNAKRDPALVQRVLAHIQEHLDLWRQASDMNPALLAATGQQVLPPMPIPGLPPGQPGMPQGGGKPPQISNPQGPANPGQDPGQPKLPKPPVDPSTGERAPVAPGTSVQ